jgi:hypothetical protein
VEENPRHGAKQAASLGVEVGATKKHKQDDSDFLWTIQEQLSKSGLGDSLDTTLGLLRAFAQDLITVRGLPSFRPF